MKNILMKIASKVEEGNDDNDTIVSQDMLISNTEYGVNVDISFSCEFEGNVDKNKLMKMLKDEIVKSIEIGVTSVSREYDLRPSNLVVQPLKFDVDVNEIAAFEDDF